MGTLVDTVTIVTGSLIDNEQGRFRVMRLCANQVFTLKQIVEKAREKEHRVCVGFIELEKAYDRVNREVLWQVLRLYDVRGKLLREFKSICVDSLDCVRVKGGESKQFRIDSGVRQGCIMSPCVFNLCLDAVMKEVKVEMGRMGVRFLEEGR